uniref:Pitrilysin metallopeptidase 1 n=1 Tax=Astyanax mexicanus TaxID=7994 RepID=A0A8B9HFI3_ASTMX
MWENQRNSSFLSYIASCWNHDGDPVHLLKISENVSRFRQCLQENPRYLQDKVRQYFKENTHQLILSMSPDEQYVEKQNEAELEKLQQKIQALTQADRKNIYEKGLQLLSEQSKTQDASSLPALKVSDITPTIPYTPVQMSTAGKHIPVQYCEQPTNGMVYFRAMCNLNTLPEDLKIYVPLFCSVITKLGCGEMDYRQQAQQMELKTGGMSVTPQILSDTAELDLYEQGILLNSSCLERNLPDMFNLWSDLFNSPHFDDEERLRVLVMMAAQELSNGISYSGHLYAMTRAARTLTPSADLQETFSGMDQVIKYSFFLINLISKMYHFRCAVNATPQKIADAAVEVERFMGNIASHRKERKPVRPNIVKRPLDLHAPSGSAASRKLISEVNFKPCQMKTYFELPYPVNFVSECVRTVPFTHEDYASLCVLGRLMSAKFLHGEIREKGGAYGGGARMGGGGLFSFYSYSTIQKFGKCYYCFCLLRSPRLSHAAGLGLFLNGVSDEIKQAHRERLFAVTHKNLIDVAGRYLGIGQRTRGVAVLGPKNENIKKDPSWVVK